MNICLFQLLYAMCNTDVYNKINTNSAEALKALYWQILVPLCSINNQRKTYTYSTMVTVVYVNMKAVSKWVWRRYMWRYWWSYFGGAIGDVIDVAIGDILVTLLVWQLMVLLRSLLVCGLPAFHNIILPLVTWICSFSPSL